MTARPSQLAPSEAVLRHNLEQAVRSCTAAQITAMRAAARQNSLSWPADVRQAYRRATRREIADGRIVCTPPDREFLQQWLSHKVAELSGLLERLARELGAEQARELILAHLKLAQSSSCDWVRPRYGYGRSAEAEAGG